MKPRKPQTSCHRCNTIHKKCDHAQPTCSRCVRLRLDCAYPDRELAQAVFDRMQGDAGQKQAQEPTPEKNTEIVGDSVAEQGSSEAVEVLFQIDTSAGQLEDPDFMPMMEDWAVVYSYYKTSGQSLFAILDPVIFLKTFFFQPAHLRFAVCAVAARGHSPRLPSSTYYDRARRSLRKDKTPSIKTVQSLYLLARYAGSFGQPERSKEYFRQLVPLVAHLKLFLDPDESPWLFHLNFENRSDCCSYARTSTRIANQAKNGCTSGN
ncbi:hypothetical protein BC830DRAFT_1141587 [Chytriomyces sp. MP71]|nr:hypothetical protein BC830DRAFT_1141587 [Chytriomyces sp. MP71]